MIQLRAIFRNASRHAEHRLSVKSRPTNEQKTDSLGLSGQNQDVTQEKETSQTEVEVNSELRVNEAERFNEASEPRAWISTGPQQQHGTFYEFRTYYIQPHLNAAFLKLTTEKIHLRTAHSELIGYWSVEYGGLNQVFHIWKYDSYAQRASVRAALAQDPNWIEQYISKAMPMLSSQDNEVTYLVPWSKVQKPPKDGGVFELATFQMKSGGPAVWGKAFQAAVGTHTGSGYAHAVGVFHSEFGLLNQVHVLWWYESADQRAATRHTSHEDARVVAAVRESAAYLLSQKSKLMFPCAFSPIK